MERKRSKIKKLVLGSPLLLILLVGILVGAVLYSGSVFFATQSSDVMLEGLEVGVFAPLVDGNALVTGTNILASDVLTENKLTLDETETFSHTVALNSGYESFGYADVSFDLSSCDWLDDPENEFYGFEVDVHDTSDTVITDDSFLIGGSLGILTFKTWYHLDPIFTDTVNLAPYVMEVVVEEHLNEPPVLASFTDTVSGDKPYPMSLFASDFGMDDEVVGSVTLVNSAISTDPMILVNCNQPSTLYVSFAVPTWTGTGAIIFEVVDELGAITETVLTIIKI